MSQDWLSDSDDSDFEWDRDGEAEPSSATAFRNSDAAGPSTLVCQKIVSFRTRASHDLLLPCYYYDFCFDICSCDCPKDSNGWTNRQAPSTSLVDGYMGMGFSKEMVLKGIKEIGNAKINKFHFICYKYLHLLFKPSILLSGHSDSNALLELLLTYKVFVYVLLLLNLSCNAFAAWWQ